LRWRRPRRQHTEIAIDLHGVGVDDDAGACLRELERQRRLAAGGRPCDKHGLGSSLASSLGSGRLGNHPMSLVATLICNPNNPALDSTILDGARAVLLSAAAARWLWDEVAADIAFDTTLKSKDALRTIENRLREVRGDLPIDIVVQP